LHAGDLETCIAMLRDTRFGGIEEVYRNTGDLALVELVLFGREVGLHLEVERDTEGTLQAFVQALTTRYEKDVLKHALRLWFDRSVRGRDIGASTSYLYRERIHNDLPLDRLIGAATFEEVVALLRSTPYRDAVSSGAGMVAEEDSLFAVEMALDRFFYRQLMQAASRLDKRDREIAERLIGIEIDVENTSWIVRLRSAYEMSAERIVGYLIPTGAGLTASAVETALNTSRVQDLLGGLLGRRLPVLQMMGESSSRSDENSRLLLVEGLLEQILRQEVRRILTGYPFTVGIILAYSLLERREMSTVVMILNAKLYGLDPERVRTIL
jgi:V/A-type H+-transporting ATPase subunit C